MVVVVVVFLQEFCTVFGMYVLDSSIFAYLRSDIDHNKRVNGDFQLTPALCRMCKERPVKGLMMHGKRYDMGNPESVLEAMVAFRKGAGDGSSTAAAAAAAGDE